MLDIIAKPFPALVPPDFLEGGGDMGRRLRAFDWSASPLGPAREWPEGLKTALRIMLASRQPMCVWWGSAYIALYNDACRAIVGDRHPDALGQSAPAAWSDVWNAVGHRAGLALRRNEGASLDALPLFVDRNGRREEAHYSAALSPLPGEPGVTGGVLCTFVDITRSVVGERQLALLKEVASRTSGEQTLAGACARAIEGLATTPADIPFAGIYLVDAVSRSAQLAASTGLLPGHALLPETVALDAQAPWPFRDAPIDSRTMQQLAIPEAMMRGVPAGPCGRTPREAAIVPLGPVGSRRRAVLVAALNPFRAFDDDYRRFMELVGAQVAAGIANAQARHEEALRLESEALREAGRDLSAELDLQRLVQKVTDAGTQLTGAKFGAFFYNVVNAAGTSYQLYTLSGAPREAFEKFGLPRATPVFKPTFMGQGPVRVDDITQDPRYGQMAPQYGMPAGHLPVRSYLAMPVISRGGEVIGGLFFGHPDAGVFDERAERAVVGLALQAAVAFDNAHLYSHARKEIERRALMEKELRASEQRYRDLVQGLPAAVYTTDAEGRIELYNDAAARLWGRSPEVGQEKWCGSERIFTPQGDEVPLSGCPMARALEGKAIDHAEIVVQRPDGSLAHALAHPRSIRDASGNLVGAVNMLVDITERIQGEAELAITKDELAGQVESLTHLHELAMRLGGISELQPALQAVLDTAVEAQGAHFGLVWLHEPDTGALVTRASRGFGAEALSRFARIMPGPDGGSAGNAFARRCRWSVEDTEFDSSFAAFRQAARDAGFRSVHSTPIVTRAGELLGVLSVHYRQPRKPLQRDLQMADVCARHAADAIEAYRSQEALRRSERIYRAIGESLDYGVWTADRDGRNTYLSESFLNLVGATQEECSGTGWARKLHPDDVEKMTAAWRLCVSEGRKWDHEFRVRGTDGGWYSILGRAVPVRDEAGHVAGWAGINLDIGRLKQVENELRQLDQRKNEFLATLAHELRNPLAPLRNGLEVLRLANGNTQMAEKARGMMERQLHQMVRLVDDLLDVSRVSRGKIELRREHVELATVLRNAIETSQPLMVERAHQLVTRIPAGKIMVHGDTTRLAQVFWNLLNNAAKYTQNGGRIVLEVKMLEREVAISVKDNGLGIPREMLSRVFDIFTQVDRSLEKTQGGLGIGLSIAKRLVEMHGGTIEVRSAGPGLGSEFCVRLPASLAEGDMADDGGTSEVARLATPRRRILIADDNADAVATLAIMLEVLGNEVRVAHDGEEAVALAQTFRPDAILLDIGMPKLNGYEACARIRLQPGLANAFIVALTGWGQEEDKHRARAAGFDRHLVKPVEPAMLDKLIQGLPLPPR